jgi:hypothetical protein
MTPKGGENLLLINLKAKNQADCPGAEVVDL